MKKEKNPRLGKVGGQAVLEGVMMRSGSHVSLAVRKEDGTIEVKNSEFHSLRRKNKFFNLPFIRGCVNMVESMKMSFSTLQDSANMLGLDGEEPETKFEKWLSEKLGDKLMGVIMGIGSVLGVVLSVALFVLLPNYAAKGANLLYENLLHAKMPDILTTVISGVLKIAIFLVYLALVSLMKDIRRTFEYHGAEHKSVACYEAGLPLTPENARKCTRFHPRCGTSFLFVMLIISIIVTMFINWDWPMPAIIAIKIALIPIIVGLGFEFLIIAGKHPNGITKALSAPGLWVQRLTTKEPDDSQLEVALAALRCAMPEEFPDAAAEFEKKDGATEEKAEEATEETSEKKADEAAPEEMSEAAAENSSGETTGNDLEKANGEAGEKAAHGNSENSGEAEDGGEETE